MLNPAREWLDRHPGITHQRIADAAGRHRPEITNLLNGSGASLRVVGGFALATRAIDPRDHVTTDEIVRWLDWRDAQPEVTP